MPTLTAIVALMSAYGYVLLFPAALIEGPIVTIIAGFLASTGVLNVYLAFLVATAGTIAGDLLYYLFGRLGNKTLIPKYGKYIGITEERLQGVDAYYDNHLWKTLFIGKLSQSPVIVPFIVAAGAARVGFKRFFFAISVVSAIESLILVLIGYYLGKSYVLIDHYLHQYVKALWFVLAILIIAYIVYRWRKNAKKASSKKENESIDHHPGV